MGWLWWCIGTVVFLFFLVLLIAFICFMRVFYFKSRKELGDDEFEIPRGEIYEEFRDVMIGWAKTARKLPHEDIEIESFDGLKLRGRYYECNPGELYFGNYDAVVNYAAQKGVKIAFENTEGEEYLAALMDAFRGEKHVGFCWDSGHEMCYNHSKDLLALYGDRLLGTHLNDNLGIRDFGGKITYIDDLHLLPFDGIADWDNIAARLDRCGFSGPLTFELNVMSKPGRRDNDIYRKLSPEEYIAECYKRACRVAAKMKGAFDLK